MSHLISEISKLSIAHRIELVQAILRTIALESKDESALTPCQIDVIEQRSAEIVAGLVKTIPWEEVQLKIQERYGLQN